MLLSWFLIEFISGGISPVAPPVETGGAIIINNHKKMFPADGFGECGMMYFD